MSDLKTFREEHGDQWGAITQEPAFAGAMSHLNLEKIARIASLTDEEIEAHGKLILADLRGHLQHENDLFTLATKQDLTFRALPPEEYSDPLEEIETNGAGPSPQSQPAPEKPPKPPRRKKK